MQELFKKIYQYKDAIFYKNAGLEITYLTLYNTVMKWNQILLDMGAKENQRIIIVCDSPIHTLVALLTAFSLGDNAVLLENGKSKTEIELLYHKINAKFIITDSQEFMCTINTLVLPEEMWCTSTSKHELRTFSFDTSLEGCMIFTSGSTSEPKAVIRTFDAIVGHAKALSAAYHFTNDDTVLFLVAFYHAYGLEHVMAAIYGGAAIETTNEFDYHAVLERIKEEQISTLIAVPFHYQMFAKLNLSLRSKRLRLMLSAGAPLPEHINRKMDSMFGFPVTQIYGSSETAANTVNSKVRENKDYQTVGTSIAGVKIRIMDNEHELKRMQKGEICISSPYCAKGYIEKTYTDYKGMVRTGDIGYLDEQGLLYIVGRIKNMINVAGKKVSPEEVEQVIRQFENVKDVRVEGIEDSNLGESIQAVIVTENGKNLNEQKLLYHCQEKLAHYKVPRKIRYVDALSFTTNGKLKR